MIILQIFFFGFLKEEIKISSEILSWTPLKIIYKFSRNSYINCSRDYSKDSLISSELYSVNPTQLPPVIACRNSFGNFQVDFFMNLSTACLGKFPRDYSRKFIKNFPTNSSINLAKDLALSSSIFCSRKVVNISSTNYAYYFKLRNFFSGILFDDGQEFPWETSTGYKPGDRLIIFSIIMWAIYLENLPGIMSSTTDFFLFSYVSGIFLKMSKQIPKTTPWAIPRKKSWEIPWKIPQINSGAFI